MEPYIALKDIHKFFPGVHALKGPGVRQAGEKIHREIPGGGVGPQAPGQQQNIQYKNETQQYDLFPQFHSELLHHFFLIIVCFHFSITSFFYFKS